MKKIIFSILLLYYMPLVGYQEVKQSDNNCAIKSLGNKYIVLQKFYNKNLDSLKQATRLWLSFNTPTGREFFEQTDKITIKMIFRDGTIISKESTVLKTSLVFPLRIHSLIFPVPIPFPIFVTERKNTIKPILLNKIEEEIFKTNHLKQIKYDNVFLSKISKKYSVEDIKNFITETQDFRETCNLQLTGERDLKK